MSNEINTLFEFKQYMQRLASFAAPIQDGGLLTKYNPLMILKCVKGCLLMTPLIFEQQSMSPVIQKLP